jgi:predicted Zn finger-like uncharacterized protein
MILNCLNCKKKFHLDNTLIPDKGRKLQCGSCNHVWFYKPENNLSKNDLKTEIINSNSNNVEDKLSKNKKVDQPSEELMQKNDTNNFEKVSNNESSFNELINENKKTKFDIGKFLSYILVFLITFFALIIVLDTFKSALNSVFPGLEIFLFNFYETLNDLYLFLKNLLS